MCIDMIEETYEQYKLRCIIEGRKENLKYFRLGKIKGIGKTSYADEFFVLGLMLEDGFLIYVLENGSLESKQIAATVLYQRNFRGALIRCNREKYFSVSVDILSKISADDIIEKVFTLEKLDLEYWFKVAYKYL